MNEKPGSKQPCVSVCVCAHLLNILSFNLGVIQKHCVADWFESAYRACSC